MLCLNFQISGSGEKGLAFMNKIFTDHTSYPNIAVFNPLLLRALHCAFALIKFLEELVHDAFKLANVNMANGFRLA